MPFTGAVLHYPLFYLEKRPASGVDRVLVSQQVLILDEISMVSAEFFAQIEQALRKIRFNPKPFGGIQLILSGDYFQ